MIEFDHSVEGLIPDPETVLILSIRTRTPVRFEMETSSKGDVPPTQRALVDVLEEFSSARLNWEENGILSFEPKVRPGSGEYRFDLSQYGIDDRVASVSPILRALLVLMADGEDSFDVHLRGGTHVRSGVPYSYLKRVYAPVLRRFGYRLELELKRWGFAPTADGLVRLTVKESDRSKSAADVSLEHRGSLEGCDGLSVVGNLSPDILHRQSRAANDRLEEAGYDRFVRSEPVESRSPGTVLHLTARYEEVRSGFYAYGRKGKRAGTVAREAVTDFLEHEKGDAPVDPILAERMVVPLLFRSGRSEIRVSRVTEKLYDKIHRARQFGYESIALEENDDGTGRLVLG